MLLLAAYVFYALVFFWAASCGVCSMQSGFTSIGEQLMPSPLIWATLFLAMLLGQLGHVQKPCALSD